MIDESDSRHIHDFHVTIVSMSFEGPLQRSEQYLRFIPSVFPEELC